MKILLDADGAPIRDIVINLSKKYGAKLLLVKNFTQVFETSYGKIIDVDVNKEEADLYIANHANKGDLVITNDRGLSSLALSKSATVLDFQGKFIDDDNILSELSRRHINRKLREQKIYTHISKRKKEDDMNFYKVLNKFLEEINMMTLFVSSLCPDCPPAIKEINDKNLNVEIVDITESMANLKRFLKERDYSEKFDKIVVENKVGVPVLKRDDDYFFFDGSLDEFLKG